MCEHVGLWVLVLWLVTGTVPRGGGSYSGIILSFCDKSYKGTESRGPDQNPVIDSPDLHRTGVKSSLTRSALTLWPGRQWMEIAPARYLCSRCTSWATMVSEIPGQASSAR